MGKKADIVRRIAESANPGEAAAEWLAKRAERKAGKLEAEVKQMMGAYKKQAIVDRMQELADEAARYVLPEMDKPEWDGKFVPGRLYYSKYAGILLCNGQDDSRDQTTINCLRIVAGEKMVDDNGWYNPVFLRPATAADLIWAGMIEG